MIDVYTCTACQRMLWLVHGRYLHLLCVLVRERAISLASCLTTVWFVIVPASLAIILIEPRNPHVTFHYWWLNFICFSLWICCLSLSSIHTWMKMGYCTYLDFYFESRGFWLWPPSLFAGIFCCNRIGLWKALQYHGVGNRLEKEHVENRHYPSAWQMSASTRNFSLSARWVTSSLMLFVLDDAKKNCANKRVLG